MVQLRNLLQIHITMESQKCLNENILRNRISWPICIVSTTTSAEIFVKNILRNLFSCVLDFEPLLLQIHVIKPQFNYNFYKYYKKAYHLVLATNRVDVLNDSRLNILYLMREKSEKYKFLFISTLMRIELNDLIWFDLILD